MTTTDSLSARHRRIAERLGYKRASGFAAHWIHAEQPKRLFEPGEVLADVQREIDRCDQDGTIDDHVFDASEPNPGDVCACGEVVFKPSAFRLREWVL